MVDFTFKHDKTVEFFQYLKNFLIETAPTDQILEELQRLTLDIAYREAKRRNKQ